MREAERSWKLEFRSAAEQRLRSIADAATELIELLEPVELGEPSSSGEPSEREGPRPNAALLQQVKSLRGTIGESDGSAEPRHDLDSLVATLRECYEALALALREDAVRVPRLRPTNYFRNVFHVCWGLFGVALILALSAWPSVLLIAALGFAGAGWAMEIGRRRSPALNQKLMRAFRRVSHPHEAHQVNSSTWYASALALLALTRDPTLMTIGVLVLGFADPAAAVIGRRFGRVELVNGRTLEGSAAFAIVGALATFAILSLAGGQLLPDYALSVRISIAGTAGLLGAIAELFSRRIDDNFSIPVAAAFGGWVVLLLLG